MGGIHLGLRFGLATGLAVVAGALAPSGAGAAIPSGNLLVNGDAETGPRALESTLSVLPQGWFSGDGSPGYPMDTNATAVGYATPGFFTAAERARIAGGQAFLAGGPRGPPGQTATT